MIGRCEIEPPFMRRRRVVNTVLTPICSEADQKKNPTAVVTALRFYAMTVVKPKNQRQSPKFMCPQQSLTASDDGQTDVDEENNRRRPGSRTGGSNQNLTAMHNESSTSDYSTGMSLSPTLRNSCSVGQLVDVSTQQQLQSNNNHISPGMHNQQQQSDEHRRPYERIAFGPSGAQPYSPAYSLLAMATSASADAQQQLQRRSELVRKTTAEAAAGEPKVILLSI